MMKKRNSIKLARGDIQRSAAPDKLEILLPQNSTVLSDEM
jgi:hypothetical protein